MDTISCAATLPESIPEGDQAFSIEEATCVGSRHKEFRRNRAMMLHTDGPCDPFIVMLGLARATGESMIRFRDDGTTRRKHCKREADHEA